jgi:hypothetical protein
LAPTFIPHDVEYLVLLDYYVPVMLYKSEEGEGESYLKDLIVASIRLLVKAEYGTG